MELSQLHKLNSVAMKLLQGEGDIKPLDEAYHEKDKIVKKEIDDFLMHHNNMQSKHRSMMGALSKDKEISKHDLAILAHKFASSHYQNLGGSNILNGSFGSHSGLPEDYHNDKDFYDKLNGMVTKRADSKSKDCGVNCD